MAARTGPLSAVDADLARFLRDELGVEASTPADAAQNWTFTGPVWVWRGSGNGPPPKAAWYFITIDGEVAAAIRTATRGNAGGFGSVRVAVTIGTTRWQTSLFPSKESGGYLLPLKASARKAERLEAETMATVDLGLTG